MCLFFSGDCVVVVAVAAAVVAAVVAAGIFVVDGDELIF